MAAGTVDYTDTTGNRDYLGIIGKQIGRRLKEASNMAAEERAFAAKKAEQGGTSLEEAGIGKGYFFKRALGSRFGGDRIARTRGRLGAQGPGTDPTKNFKQRFRGGFDYNVTNQINQVTKEVSSAVVPMSSALVTGLRGVEGGLSDVGNAVNNLSNSIGQLARSQEDMAREVMMMGAFMRAFMSWMQRQQSRSSANKEEKSIENALKKLKGSSGRGGNIRGLLSGGGGGASKAQSAIGAASSIANLAGIATNKKTGQALELLSKSPQAAATAVRGAQTGSRMLLSAGRTGISVTSKKITDAVMRRSAQNLGAKSLQEGFENQNAAVKTKKAIGGTRVNPRQMKYDIIPFPKDQLGRAIAAERGFRTPDAWYAKQWYDMVNYRGKSSEEAVQAILKVDPSAAAFLQSAKETGKSLGATTLAGATPGSTINQAVRSSDDALKTAIGASDGILARLFGKGIGKSIMKKIPVLAGIAGIVFGIQRALEGDFLGAGLEITSGILGATGVGAGASVGIDAFLIARDLGMGVPMAEGGIPLGRNVSAILNDRPDRAKEAVMPLTKETFLSFGEGVLDAQKLRKRETIKLHAAGLSEYYDKQGGWKTFAEITKDAGNWIKNFFGGLGIGGGKEEEDTPAAGAGADPTTTVGVGRNKMEQHILEFRQARNEKFGVTSERNASNTTGNLMIRDLRAQGSTGRDSTINPYADDLSYQVDDHQGDAHRHGYGFDIPVANADQAAFVIDFWRNKRGYKILYGDAGHKNHVHVEVPRAKMEEYMKKVEAKVEKTPEMSSFREDPEENRILQEKERYKKISYDPNKIFDKTSEDLKTASLMNSKSLETSGLGMFSTPITNIVNNNYYGGGQEGGGQIVDEAANPFIASGTDFARFKFVADLG